MVGRSRTLAMLLLAALLAIARADVYLHSPRGSNNRCDEKNNNRDNERRCFNSQNNAAGGYAVCDKEMVFYTDTVLNIEWYSQHNCGNGAKMKDDPQNPEAVHCQHVLQLGCDFAFAQFAAEDETYALADGKSLGRPGADAANKIKNAGDVFNTFGDTCTQQRPTAAICAQGTHNSPTCATLDLSKGTGTFNSGTCSCSPRKMQTYCYHEPEGFYRKCRLRERNKGLFTADQNVRNDGGASYTRQRPNGDRYGFECSEERDYWPYWHPTPYIDLAVFTSNTSMCSSYTANSQNTMDKCECLAADNAKQNVKNAAMTINQEAPCKKAGFNWKCWGKWNWPAPECNLASQQPDNSLARVSTKGDNPDDVDGSTLASYQWTIPESIIPAGKEEARCFVRIRYNISNAEVPDDYDVADNVKLKNNPVYTFGSGKDDSPVDMAMPLRLAIDTAQYGRTFQDRSWSFTIKKRPDNLVGKTIHNVNVRGKRGNIAQVRNCFEYDFVPLVLNANVGDIVHFQWCLSDYNPNGNAGEGRQGTDRVNVVPISAYDKNIFTPLNATNTIFTSTDLAQLAWLGQQPKDCFTTKEMLTTQKNNQNDPKSCHFLNGVRDETGLPTAYFSHMATVTGTGTFQFISSRNNNFSNRSQKATIVVGAGLSKGAIAGIAVGATAGVAAIGGAGIFMVKKKGLLSFSSRV